MLCYTLRPSPSKNFLFLDEILFFDVFLTSSVRQFRWNNTFSTFISTFIAIFRYITIIQIDYFFQIKFMITFDD